MNFDLISLSEALHALSARLNELFEQGELDSEAIADIQAQMSYLAAEAHRVLETTTPPEVEDEVEALPLGFSYSTLLRVRMAVSLPIALYHSLPDDPFVRALRGLTWAPFAPWVMALSKRLIALNPDEDTLFTTAELLALEQGMHVVALAAIHGMYEKLGWDAPDEPMAFEDGRLRHEIEFALAPAISDGTTRYLGEDHPARQQAAREIAAFAARVANL